MGIKIANFEMKNPIIAASGTFGYADEYEDFCDVSKIGAIATKGITLEPRGGNEGDRIFETNSGMINRIGLENIGIERFIDEKIPILKKKNITYILNAAGSTIDDYSKLAQIADKNGIEAVELNVSCPNVKSGCLEFGVDSNSLYELVLNVRKNYGGCLIVKLTPNVTSIENLALAVQNAGADAISAINTLKGLGIKIDFINGKFYKKEVQGGLSGKCIKPVALSMVKRIAAVTKLPIIGMGGISCLDDLFEFISAGADAFEVGTQNFTQCDVCNNLADELENFIKTNGFKDFEDLKEKIKEID